MKRKALVLAICMAFATPVFSARNALPSNTVGLNLGEIQSTTFLNEPFNGQIPILFSSKADARLLKVRLAPASIFAQIGAERLPLLNDLDFNIAVVNNKPVIEIRSINTIDQPFLNFVLEIERKQGKKIYQDFTVMLDPRGLQTEQPKKYLSHQNTGRKSKILLPTTHSSSSLLSKGNQTKYTIQAGDSLSKIAHELKASGISLNNIIEGIRLKNPQSFSDINKIVKGEVINLPTFNELRDFTTLIKESAQASSKTKTANPESTISYKVKSGDTLYRITKKFMRSDTSFTKLMNSIHIKNPQAFSQNRINVLIAGAVLQIPSIDKSHIQKNQVAETQQQIEQSKAKTPVTSSGHNNTKITTAPDLAIINNKEARNGNNIEKNSDIVQSLEKRVRELRNKLSKVTSDFSSLENTLSSNENLLLKQQNEVELLKSTISSLKEDQQAPTKINKLSENSEIAVVPKVIETPLLPNNTDNVKSFETKNTNDTTKNFEAIKTNESLEAVKISELLEIAEDQQNTMNQATSDLFEATETFEAPETIEIPEVFETPESIDTPKTSETIKTPENIELSDTFVTTDNSESNNETIISKVEKLYTSDGVGYALLLLVLGILAIRFRKKSQAYASIPNDQPTFYKEDKYSFTEDKYSFTEKTEQIDATANNHDTNIAHTRKGHDKTPKVDTPTVFDEIKLPNHAENSLEEKRTYKDVPDEEIQVSNIEIEECEVLVDSLLGELLVELEGSPESNEQELSDNDSFLNTAFDEEVSSLLDIDKELTMNTQISNPSTDHSLEKLKGSDELFELIDNTLDQQSENMPESSPTDEVTSSIDINHFDKDDNLVITSESHSLDDFQDFQSDLLVTTDTSQMTTDTNMSFESVFDDLTNSDFNKDKLIDPEKYDGDKKEELTKNLNITEISGFDCEKTG